VGAPGNVGGYPHVAGGTLGWVLAKLVFKPLEEIIDLRRETQEILIIRGNVGEDAAKAERDEAAEAFRRVGAALVSRHLAAFPWVQVFCRGCLGWEPHSAGALLISLGNNTYGRLSKSLPL
jgi:hypothetical protein